MAKNLAQHVSTRKTAQTERIPGPQGARQVENSAGGFAFKVDKWDRLKRFLILGSDRGSYYASEQKLTADNAQCVQECAKEDFQRTLDTIVSVSDQGQAPKNDPAILALALLCSHEPPNSGLAFAQLPKVCRIGTHVFTFVDMLQHLRGRGRSFRRALQNWYLEKDAKSVAFQVTKYQQRSRWSHKDIFRLVKPKTEDASLDGVFAYVTGKDWKTKMPEGAARTYLEAVELVKNADSKVQVCNLIREYNLPREVIPTEWLKEPAVWEAMLERMPATALIRNLGKLSSIDLAKPMSTASGTICAKLADGEWLRKSRLHPLAVLVALGIYKQGYGLRGSLTWVPDSNVIDALDAAFYDCFQHVKPTGKKHMLAIDISGSMTWDTICNTTLTPRDAAAAMAMVNVRTEAQTLVTAFSAGGTRIGRGRCRWGPGIEVVGDLTKQSRLDHAVNAINSKDFGQTDCALPMLYATQERLDIDTFVVYTDSETWAGDVHPVQALREYREKFNPRAKLIVCGMVANEFTIADPNDAGMMDVVGFDTAAPAVMADFARD